jgi:ribosomal protein L37E
MAERAAGSVDPSEAFSLVASETRFAVLRALWDLTSGTGTNTASFATLREESGIRDSGQFNYHLDQLTPQFVRKVDGEYQLTVAGRRVVGGVVSGGFTDLETAMDPRPVGDCPDCGGTNELRYRDGQMTVDCRDCGRQAANMHAPPVLVANVDDDALPRVLGTYLTTEIQRLNRGFCLYCGGQLRSEIVRDDDGGLREDWNVSLTCTVCGHVSYSLVRGTVIDHPAVVSLLFEAGIDVRERPLWELDPILDATERVVAEDPLRVETTIETDAAALTLTVDDSLDVVEYERRETSGTE